MNRIVQYTLKLFGQIRPKILLLLPCRPVPVHNLQVWHNNQDLVNVELSNGTVAEWLGRGLQNLLQQFESARYLQKPISMPYRFF